MHQPIRDNLEEYLKGPARKVPQEFHSHLEACQDCARELGVFETHAETLRSLRSTGEIEPRAGFYARVMDRIERRGPASIWAVLLEPSFGRRLAMASAALVLLLGTYLVTTEPGGEPEVAVQQVMLTDMPAGEVAVQDSIQQQRQRDAVLVNLAGYHQ